jgi:hypothetical protein
MSSEALVCYDAPTEVHECTEQAFYFESDALKALKLLAAASGVSVADKVSEAVDLMLAAQVSTIDWKREIEGVLARAQSRGLPDLSGPEIVEVVRSARRAKKTSNP